jgi:serine phosphatase RsbU (regulator of sigma subunit)/anti-sigma regulatory factor (Ser/Thr protein kinase)
MRPPASRARTDPADPSDRLAELQRVTDAALAYLPLEELLAELLARITEILDADTAAVLLLDRSEKTLIARAAHGIEEEVARGVRIPLGAGFAGRIAAQRRPITVDDVDHAEIRNPILREKGIKSLVGVPLLIEGRVLGVLHVGSLVGRQFNEDDVALLQLAADRAALGIEHAQLTHERQVAGTLQRSLMPAELPMVPGLGLAGRYMPAAEVGGDWYDAFLVPGGDVVLVIGDVMGRGVPAAALMAQLRTAVRAYFFPGDLAGVDLGEMGGRLNSLLLHLAHEQMATFTCLLLDPDTRTFRLLSAGHLPPLLIGPDGQSSYLAIEGSPPVGLTSAAVFQEETFEFPVGSTLLLYTDGLVEVREEIVDQGLERLQGVVATPTPDLEWLCDHVVSAMVELDSPDDVALLAARVLPLGAETETRWPAEVDALKRIRSFLRRWLREQGATEEEAFDLTVAAQEACTNAIQHAYGPGSAEFVLYARHIGDEIIIGVHDQGGWRTQRGSNRGRGMPVMRSLTDAVEVQSDSSGTNVELRRRLQGGPDA